MNFTIDDVRRIRENAAILRRDTGNQSAHAEALAFDAQAIEAICEFILFMTTDDGK